ncbi:MAG: hypothetical protein FWH18_11275, partial [Marinilabiliaceae bacterium]|nr:hypothetical protein [Marinilabiliaceae bacterium]
MKNLIIFGLLLLTSGINLNAQNVLVNEEPFWCEVEGDFEPYQKRGDVGDIYKNLRTWIPYCDSEPLKNPPITYIEISFHVFLDDNGGNSYYTNTPEGKDRLIYIFNMANQIYSGGWGPSNPVPGVVELPNYDTRIRFTLGDNNERIYFYNNTTLNHSRVGFYEYLNDTLPDRIKKLNVFFTAGHSNGHVIEENILITNGGFGYTSPPTITFDPAGGGNNPTAATAIIQNGVLVGINLTSGGSYNGFSPPIITISGGGGSGATAIVTQLDGGAGASALGPSNDNYSFTSYVTFYKCYQFNQYTLNIHGAVLAHEFGHNLDLDHTYCLNPVICTDYCHLVCEHGVCNDDEYLSDIFGTCPGTYPHLQIWANPYDNTLPNAEKITNNIVGGSSSQVYVSPMQAGQMHRSLALKSVRKYVRDDCFSNIPLVINSDEEWDFNIKLYRDIVIPSGSVLTISGTVLMPPQGKITVQTGGKLVINGGKITGFEDKQFWQGIIVNGSMSTPQSPQNQGSVILTNATIENAVIAINTSASKPYIRKG